MGGYDGDRFLNDVNIYDHETKTIEKKTPSQLAFLSRGNVVKLGDGICQALVKDEKSQVHLVRYSHGTVIDEENLGKEWEEDTWWGN